MRRKNKGITLIALIITIIVLLILAGVGIATLTGENGILIQANKAKKETEIAKIIEDIKLEIYNKQTENLGNITEQEVIDIIERYGTISNDKLITNKGNYEIELKDISNIFNAKKYLGKRVSILGDSISTLKGYIPEGNRARYVTEEEEAVNGLIQMNYEETWWGGIINELGMNLGINESWAGSRVSNTSTSNSGDLGPDRCMAGKTRINNLDNNGIPDVIFFFGGTNDIGGNVTKGSFNSEVEYDDDTTTYTNFAEAYTIAIKRLRETYPQAEIIVILPTYTSSYYTTDELNEYNEIMIEICDYYNVKYIDLRNCITTQYLEDGIHPNKEGMKLIIDYIKSELLGNEQDDNNSNAGEETEDNNSSNSHLQSLPNDFTSTTDLTEVLTLINEYYNGITWATSTGTGLIYSITIPVAEGDKIESTSFGAKTTNGSGGEVNGIRVTYFNDDTVVSSLAPAMVYSEFSANGYLTIPSGVNAVCIPFWNNDESNYCYLTKNN